jgi:uncharacterized protein
MEHPTTRVEYHRALVSDKRRIGRGILAIVLLLSGFQLFSLAFVTGAALLDAALGADARAGYTPMTHAAGLLSLALLIPWSMLIQRWLYGVRPGSLSSVVSRFRFDVLGRALVPVVIGVVAILVIQYWTPLPDTTWAYRELLWLIAIALVLTPFQAAGEEYGFRGLIFRVASSWTRGSRSGLFVGIAVSSVLFAVVHASTSGWLNVWYLVFAIGTALITWRTDGLEVAVVLHAAYNSLSFVFDAALRVDPTMATDRTAAGTDIDVLLPGVLVVLVIIVVFLATRRAGAPRTPAVGIATSQNAVHTAR